MICPLCKGEMKPSTTIHTVQLKNCVVVIKNVPCLKCEQCGEVGLVCRDSEQVRLFPKNTCVCGSRKSIPFPRSPRWVYCAE